MNLLLNPCLMYTTGSGTIPGWNELAFVIWVGIHLTGYHKCPIGRLFSLKIKDLGRKTAFLYVYSLSEMYIHCANLRHSKGLYRNQKKYIFSIFLLVS